MLRRVISRPTPQHVKSEPVDLLARNQGAITTILADMEERLIHAVKNGIHGKIAFEVNLTATAGVVDYVPLSGERLKFS